MEPGPSLRASGLLHRGLAGRLHVPRELVAQGALWQVHAAAHPQEPAHEAWRADAAEADARVRRRRSRGGDALTASHRPLPRPPRRIPPLAVLRHPDAGTVARSALDSLRASPGILGAAGAGR